MKEFPVFIIYSLHVLKHDIFWHSLKILFFSHPSGETVIKKPWTEFMTLSVDILAHSNINHAKRRTKRSVDIFKQLWRLSLCHLELESELGIKYVGLFKNDIWLTIELFLVNWVNQFFFLTIEIQKENDKYYP